MSNKGEASSHNHLIDSHNLFCCIAAVVPSWPGEKKEKVLPLKGTTSTQRCVNLIDLRAASEAHVLI